MEQGKKVAYTSPNELKKRRKSLFSSGITSTILQNKVLLLTKLFMMLERMRKDLGMRVEQLELLLYTVMVYMEDNRSISQYEYTQRFSNGNSKVIICVRAKAMVRKGYLEIVGISKRRSPLYIPTDKALQMVNKYFNVEDIGIIFNNAA